jgi:hypothetical protein
MTKLGWTALALAMAFVSCGDDDAADAPICVPAPRECAPLYEPTYEALFTRTFNPSCGIAGSTCHMSRGAGSAGGLTFDDPGRSYRILTDASRRWRLVEGGNPECSKIVYKITAHDLKVVMPPGHPLSEAEQCGIITWIARGAPR